MRRREFITLVGGGAAAWPLAARAQQSERVKRLGFLTPFSADDPDGQLRMDALRKRMQELGWVPGRNLSIEHRWATGNPDLLRSYATELVDMRPDVLLGASSPAVRALKERTREIPIVFMQVVDPVALGFALSLARPGGNLTGFTNFEFPMGGKWLGLLKEVAPRLSRIAVIYSPTTAPYAESMLLAIKAGAPSFAMEVMDAPAQDATQIKRAIDDFAHKPNGGLVVLPDVTTTVNRDLIIDLAIQNRLPAIYPFRYFVSRGGLMSYGVNDLEITRQAAGYIDRILRGTKLTDLPVQAPNKFELTINLKTAKAMGLDVPLQLQQLADEVIE
jgi:putative ABC transport system substrate-binding protein